MPNEGVWTLQPIVEVDAVTFQVRVARTPEWEKRNTRGPTDLIHDVVQRISDRVWSSISPDTTAPTMSVHPGWHHRTLMPLSEKVVPSFRWVAEASGLTASGSPASVVPVLSGSRFQCLANHDSESDTESVPDIDRRTRKRLSLIWRADPVATPDVPDSHDRRFLPREKCNAVGA